MSMWITSALGDALSLAMRIRDHQSRPGGGGRRHQLRHPNPFEVTLAKMICSWVPSVQKGGCANSGTEACMSAIRLARGFTKRDKIIKFDGLLSRARGARCWSRPSRD